MKILITESQLQNVITPYHIDYGVRKEKLNSQIIENWNSLPYKEKKMVVEIYKVLHPEHTKLINESRWWNTVGDIVGIFDPTGVTDLVNGLDYFRQGDKMYGMLSLIAAVPYIGDVVAKPIVGMMKLGGEGAKLLRSAKTTTEFAAAAKKLPMFAKLLEKIGQIGPKLLEMLKKLVGKIPILGKGLLTTIEEWVKLFGDAAKQYKLPTKMVGVKGAGFIMKPVEKIDLLKSIGQILKPGAKGTKAFRSYKAANPKFWNKYIVGGVGRVWNNRETRSLMRRTKWYLKFLNYLGLASFLDPDQLDAKLGPENVVNKLNQYVTTPESEQSFDSDMSGVDAQQMGSQPQSGGGFNLGSMLGGGSLSPEMMNVLKMMATSAV